MQIRIISAVNRICKQQKADSDSELRLTKLYYQFSLLTKYLIEFPRKDSDFYLRWIRHRKREISRENGKFLGKMSKMFTKKFLSGAMLRHRKRENSRENEKNLHYFRQKQTILSDRKNFKKKTAVFSSIPPEPNIAHCIKNWGKKRLLGNLNNKFEQLKWAKDKRWIINWYENSILCHLEEYSLDRFKMTEWIWPNHDNDEP